jgi:hypothetical protein
VLVKGLVTKDLQEAGSSGGMTTGSTSISNQVKGEVHEAQFDTSSPDQFGV